MRLGWPGAWVLVVWTLAAAVTPPASAETKVTPGSRTEIQMSFAPLVKKAAPAVVNIYTKKVVRTRQYGTLFDDPFFRQFFGEGFGFNVPRQRERIQNSLGSGVIVRADGLIVTNHHVIEGADEITIVLPDRREFEAKVIADDKLTDLALLRVEAKDGPLPYLELRDSDDLEVGDLVLAIGNPFGVGQTVTSGIVSAMARTHVGISDMGFFIQTDAAINPGNSGGALISVDGQLVGINTAIFSKSGGSHGIGFAIPSNMIRAVLAGLRDDGTLVRAWLGAWGQAVTNEIAGSLGLKRPGGVLINEVYPNGPAALAKMKVGDVVLAIDGHEVGDPGALRFRIATLPIDHVAKLTVWRRENKIDLAVKLVPPPEVPARDERILDGEQPMAGSAVANMSPALAEELGFERQVSGVMILRIRRGSPADRFGFEPGDLVREINDTEISSVAELVAALNADVPRWRITVQRGEKVLSLVVNR